jgi:hypothetical protein
LADVDPVRAIALAPICSFLMDKRVTTLERAYQLAKSGKCRGVAQTKDRLRVEGYADIPTQIYGPARCCQTKLAGAGFAPAAFPISGSRHRFLEQTQDKMRRPGALDIRPFA